MVRERSRQEELNEILDKAIQEGDLPQLNYEFDPYGVMAQSDNDLLVSLNDIHYGATVENYWNTYNSEICREMMRRYLDSIIQIARTHANQNCIVWANGDEISGNIHKSITMTNKENVIEQINRCTLSCPVISITVRWMMSRGEEMEEKKGRKSWIISDELWKEIKEYIPKKQRDPSKQYQKAPGQGRPSLPARQVLHGFDKIFY